MKPTPLIALFAAFAALPCAGQEWSHFLRQTQLDTGIIWDQPVPVNGTGPSALRLELSGALFQIWSLNLKDGTDYLLDQQLVGAYLPRAEIQIKTGDPYARAHRTRADQPFTVDVTVSGLLSGPDLPAAAGRVILEHHLAEADAVTGSVTPPDYVAESEPYQQTSLVENKTFTLEFPATNLSATDPTKARGEEHFVVHALADNNVPRAQLASSYVEVWPVASAMITGIGEGEVVRFNSPPIELHLDDLYPASTTYLQIYPGSPALGTVGERIEGSTLVLNQDRSEDRVIRLPHWINSLSASGIYTMEVVTITPFGTERLAWLSFELDRTIRVNAQLTGIESTRPTVITPTP